MSLAQLLTSVPVSPGADEARRLIDDELAKRQYHGSESLLMRAWNWLINHLMNLQLPTGGVPWQALLVVLAIIGLLGLAAFRISGPLRRSAKASSGGVFAPDDVRTTSEILEQAEQLAAWGRWRDAGIEVFRALALSLAQRELIQLTQGLTAQEVTCQAGRRLPSLAAALVEASADFDRLAYGHHPGDQDIYQRLHDLHEVVAATKAELDLDQSQAAVVTL